MRVFLRSTIICFIVSSLNAIILVWINRGWGRSEFPFFLFATAIFSLGSALLFFPFSKITKFLRFPILVSWFLAACLGVAFAIIGMFFLAIFLGPWMGAVSIPVWWVWAGGAAGSVSLECLYLRIRHRFIQLIIPFLTSSLVIAALSWSFPYEEIKLSFWKLTAGESELLLSSRVQVDPWDKEQFMRLGIKGRLTYQGGGRYGRGSSNLFFRKKIKTAIIIMKHKVDQKTKIMQPRWGDKIVYLQEIDGWKMFPNIPTSKDAIWLGPYEEWGRGRADPDTTTFSLEHFGSGGTAIYWKT